MKISGKKKAKLVTEQRNSKIYSNKKIKHQRFLIFQGFPGGAVVENLPANTGDTGSSPGLGRSHMPQSD